MKTIVQQRLRVSHVNLIKTLSVGWTAANLEQLAPELGQDRAYLKCLRLTVEGVIIYSHATPLVSSYNCSLPCTIMQARRR